MNTDRAKKTARFSVMARIVEPRARLMHTFAGLEGLRYLVEQLVYLFHIVIAVQQCTLPSHSWRVRMIE